MNQGADYGRLARLGRIVTGWPRLSIGAAVAVVVIVACLALGIRPITAMILGWDAGVVVFFVAVAELALGADPADIRRRAARQDVGQFVVLALSAVAAVASVVAIYAEVSGAGGEPVGGSHLVLGVATIVLSWFFVHAMFALHYAHEYYSPVRGDPPGLKFPGTDPDPDYLDFFYVSLVIGMSAQVSDVDVSGRSVRRTVLVQGIVAFWFNAELLALLINIAADAIRG